MSKRLDAFDPVAFLVARGLLPAGPGIETRRLAGGYQNEVFRVLGGDVGQDVDWVVKRFRPQSELTLFPNDAVAEALALRQLGPHGLAPGFIDFAAETECGPVLAYRFYDGPTWRAGDVVPVAALLARLHALPAAGFRIAAVAPSEILAEGQRLADSLAEAAVRAELADLRPAPVALAPGRRSVIHTDAGPGNIVIGADGLRLIDWQCPALGGAAEDIAAFLSPAFQILYGCRPLDAAARDAFLDAYGDAATVDRFLTLEPFFNWRMAAYCAMRIAQYRISRPEASAAYQRAYDVLAALLRTERAA